MLKFKSTGILSRSLNPLYILFFFAVLGASLVASVSIYDSSNAQSVTVTETKCTSAGGVWQNTAGVGQPPKLGCTGVDIASLQGLDWQIRSLLYYRSLSQCFQGDMNGFILGSDVNSGKWFSANRYSPINIGPYMRDLLPDVGEDGGTSCTGEAGRSLVNGALNLWGISPKQLLCAIGYTWKEFQGNTARCVNESGSEMSSTYTNGSGTREQAFMTYIKGLFYSSTGSVSLKEPAWYSFYNKVFFQQCAKGQTISSGKTSRPLGELTNRDIEVTLAKPDGSTQTLWFYINFDKDMPFVSRLGEPTSYPNVQKTCAEVVGHLRNLANAYILAVGVDPSINDEAGPTITPTEDGQSSCAIDGIGWLLCPVLTAGANLADSAYKFIADEFLVTNVALLNTDPSAEGGNGTYVAWGVMRSIANVAFIIAFLITIFSQLSSLGVSNYGVKKMLPRLIVGAILVNISFFVCQLAVDLSNVLGYSLKNALSGVADQINTQTGGAAANPEDQSGNLGGIAVLVLAAAGFAWVNISALIIGVVGAIISLLTIFVILIVRQVLVVLLIVVAPLAFVAYLLPNTQPLFDRWRKLFTTLLLLFPLLGLLYGASTLASAIILQSAGDNMVWKIAGYMALVVPLLAIFPLMKGALDGVGKIGGALQSFGKKAQGIGEGTAKSGIASYQNSGLGKFRSNLKSDRKARIAAGTYRGSNRNPLNWGRNIRASANSALNTNRTLNTLTGGFGAERELAAEAQNRKDQQEAIAMFGGDDALIAAWAMSGGDDKHASFVTLSDAQKAQFRKMRDAGHHRKATSHLAAAQYMSENGKADAATVYQALSHARSMGASETSVNGATQAALAAYRKSGRGDALADLSTATGKVMSKQQGWSEVGASSVHRDGIKPGTAGRSAYEAHLAADSENTRKALVGYDSMEARAQASAESAIIAAAQAHEYNATGATPTISTIQDAKAYFGVK